MPKYKVLINKEKCKGCGLCVHFCPKAVLKIDESEVNKNSVHPAVVVNQDACIGCKFCANICPDAAIEIIKED